MTKFLKINLKKQVKPITYFRTKVAKRITINLVMLPLKEQEEGVVFQILIFQGLFPISLVQTFLMIFLKVLVEEGDNKEDLRLLEEKI